MKRKNISMLLILVTLVVNIGFIINMEAPTFAYTVTQMAQEINRRYLYDESGARAFVKQELGEANYETAQKRVANIAILKDFNKLVYTDPKYDYYGYKGQEDYQKDENGQWHYRYLGYTFDDSTKVTNPLYPNVDGTTDFFSTYKSKNWIKKSGAKDSWIINDSLEKHMLTYPKISAQDNGRYKSGSMNIKDDVLGGKSIDEAKEYAIFQTPSTLKMTGSVRLWHEIASGKRYYRTLDTAPVPFSLPQLIVSVEKPLYQYGKEEMTKTIKVETEIYFDSFDKLDGWGLNDYVKEFVITVNGEKKTVHFENGKLKATFEFDEPRTKFPAGMIKEYPIKAQAVMVSNDLFKDQFTCYGKTSTNILVTEGEIAPQFTIKNNGVDVTDDVIEYRDWEDINLTLEPDNRISGVNEITDVLWTLKGSPNEFKFGNQDVDYKMTESKLASHTDENGVAYFEMKIFTKHKFDYGGKKGITDFVVPHTVTFRKTDVPDPTIPTKQEPVAKLRAPSKVRMGDRFTISGTGSYDPDGKIVDYDFKLQAIRELKWLNDDKSRVKVTVMSTSDKDIKLIVTDDDGLKDSTTDEIEILPPVEASMHVEGYRKVNRKITLDASDSYDAYYFPIDDYSWTITPLDGQSNTVNYGTDDIANINYETNNKGEKVNVLIKEPGAYEVTLNIHAQCTLEDDEEYEATDRISYPITIKPDLQPIAGLTVISLALRDKMDELNASIEMLDTSYSEDGDQTKVVQWYARHDSDNDGDKADEMWRPIGTGQVQEIYKTNKLGQYDFYNEVVEIIPEEETISRYLTEADYMTDTSLDQANEERYCHVDNVAPIISTTAELEKEIDLLVITDESGQNYASLLSQMNKLTKEMYERKIGVNHKLIHSEDLAKSVAGIKQETTYNWHRYGYLDLDYAYYTVHKYYDRSRQYNTIERNPTITLRTPSIMSRAGTLNEMLKFETYPEAFAETSGTPRIYEKETSNSVRWEIGGLEINMYNGPYDYAGSYSYPRHSVMRDYMGSSYDKFSVYMNSQSRHFPPESVGDVVNEYDDLYEADSIILPNAYSARVDTQWQQGSPVSIEEKPFEIATIDSLFTEYLGNKNDKYLIISIGSGENVLFTEDTLKRIRDEYGFKIYFSIDEYWGEFTPNVPKINVIAFENGSIFGQTKYGNVVKNTYNSSTNKSEMDYLDKNQYDIDFEPEFPSLRKGSQVSDSSFYMITDFIDTDRMEEGTGTQGYYDWKGRWVKVYDYFYYLWSNGSDPEITTALVTRKSIGDDFTDVNGITAKNIKAIYNTDSSHGNAIMDENNRVYVTQGNRYLKGLNLIELDLKSIKNVYYVTLNAKPTFSYGFNTRYDDDLGKNVFKGFYFSFRTQTNNRYILIEDLDGKVAVVDCIRNGTEPLYLKSLTDFQIATYDSRKESNVNSAYFSLDTQAKNFDLSERVQVSGLKSSGVLNITARSGFSQEEVYEGVLDAYYNIRSRFDRASDCNVDVSAFHDYIALDIDGNLRKNGVIGARNVKSFAIYQDSLDRLSVAFVNYDGEVYGTGNSANGELGFSTPNVVTSPQKVFNSKYTLNGSFNSKAFLSVYDIVSKTPEYGLVARGEYEQITDSIIGLYEDYNSTETIFIQVGDTIDIGGFVLDYEGDPIYEKRIDVAHDNSYFDNASTPWTPPADFDEPVTVDVPGKMEIRLRAQDNPVGQDERFAEYRYWNKDNTSIEVIAHRPPVAKLGYALVPQGDGSFNFSGTDTGSYDLDHSLSRNDKGIVARKFYYRKELDPTWTEFSGMLPIQNDLQYQFALRVQDLEGAWSDYDIVDIEIKGEPFILNAGLSPATLPAGSFLEIEGLVFTYKAIQSVTASVDGVNVPLSKTDTNGMENTYKAVYTVPQTKADGPYPVLVTATAVDGTSRVAPLELLVNTPISVTGQVIPDTLKKGQVGRLTAQTEAYASSCSVKLFEGTPDMVQVSLSKDGAPVNGKQKWQGTYTFNENRPEGAYRAVFEANTPNGNTGEYVDTFTFIPNQPPSVAYVNKTPQFVYVSDDVILNFLPTDPDGDPLDFLAEVSRDGGASWQVVASENVPSGISQPVVVENAVLGTCRVRVRVSDPLGEEATAQTSFTVNSLGVTGQVDHTQQWNENRIAYNESKGGGSESPRPYTIFWPGERFKLTGFSTKIHSDSDVKCVSLTVEIKSKNYKKSLGKDSSKSTSDAEGWSGEIWDKSMLEWKSQPLTFVFTATYSNGFVAVEEVQVNIDSTEDYWQHHRIF